MLHGVARWELSVFHFDDTVRPEKAIESLGLIGRVSGSDFEEFVQHCLVKSHGKQKSRASLRSLLLSGLVPRLALRSTHLLGDQTD